MFIGSGKLVGALGRATIGRLGGCGWPSLYTNVGRYVRSLVGVTDGM